MSVAPAVSAPPAPLGALIGRDAERTELAGLLLAGTQRLVTVVGLTGIGKTRLAVAVADLARRAGATVHWHVGAPPAGIGDAVDRAAAATLVVVDDATPAAVAALVPLLRARGGLRVLCTARRPLGVPDELVVPLAPLDTPGSMTDPGALAESPAAALLLHHIRRVRPGFELNWPNATAVAALLRRLDGVPVVLAAAASWFLVYEPAELLACLRADPLGIATDRLLDWSTSVRTTIADLDPTEAEVLAILAGRGPADTAELVARTGWPTGVCAGTVRRLVLCGLVVAAGGGRFRMLAPVRAAHHAGAAARNCRPTAAGAAADGSVRALASR